MFSEYLTLTFNVSLPLGIRDREARGTWLQMSLCCLSKKQGTHREEDHLELMDLENDKKKSKLQIKFSLEEFFVIYCLCCETRVSCSQESPGQVFTVVSVNIRLDAMHPGISSPVSVRDNGLLSGVLFLS